MAMLSRMFKGMMVVGLGLSLTACYQQSSNFEFASETGEGKVLLPDYGLVAPQVIVYNYTDPGLLALPANNESPTDIRTRRLDLGDSDASARIYRDPKASAGRFKIIIENNMNACADSMGFNAAPTAGQQAARQRLFPSSSWDAASFDTLFLSFFGRRPNGDEINVLLNLVNNSGLSDQVKHAATCAAALSSLTALNGS